MTSTEIILRHLNHSSLNRLRPEDLTPELVGEVQRFATADMQPALAGACTQWLVLRRLVLAALIESREGQRVVDVEVPDALEAVAALRSAGLAFKLRLHDPATAEVWDTAPDSPITRWRLEITGQPGR